LRSRPELPAAPARSLSSPPTTPSPRCTPACGTSLRCTCRDVDAARITYLGLDDATDVQELDRAELLARAEAGDVVVLDVRPVEEYATGHIPGAL
jgi:hypothetical protein